jgi:hypothetical protein
MPVTVDTVEVYAGDTITWPTYTLKTSNGVARDLVAEGWTDWAVQWRATPESPSEVTLDFDGSRLAEGILLVSASPLNTRNMQSAGVWDIQAERNGEVRTFLRGKTKWVQDVTRSE